MTSRRIVPLLLAAAAVSLLWAAPAGAATPRIICPLVTSCCPLPIATPTPSPSVCCAPPSTLCLALPTIASTPEPSLAGRPVTVSGWSRAGPREAQVILWQKLPGAVGFQSVARTVTNSSGQYAFALGPAPLTQTGIGT